jgi:hypothetical protein
MESWRPYWMACVVVFDSLPFGKKKKLARMLKSPCHIIWRMTVMLLMKMPVPLVAIVIS